MQALNTDALPCTIAVRRKTPIYQWVRGMNDDNIQRRLWKTPSNHRFKTLPMAALTLAYLEMGQKCFGVYEKGNSRDFSRPALKCCSCDFRLKRSGKL
jgi:hypothetical protein